MEYVKKMKGVKNVSAIFTQSRKLSNEDALLLTENRIVFYWV